MNRKKIVAGNWKMNLSFEEALKLARDVSHIGVPSGVEVILGVPFPYLKSIVDMLIHVPNVHVAAQNVHHKSTGPHTGDVSAIMLSSISCPYVIIGHSERRSAYQETNDMLADKINLALQHNIKVIYCCGESLKTRNQKKHVQFVTQQILEGLFHLTPNQMKSLIVAYEPIWAIGTGVTASSQQAEEMHTAIRTFIASRYSGKIADQIPILYGGSVKPNNAGELFLQSNIDGGLVGGASLDVESFEVIIHA